MQSMKGLAYHAGPILAILLLSNCGSSPTDPGLGGEGLLIGNYSLSGDSVFIHYPARERVRCEGDVLVRDTIESRTSANRFTLQGDRFRVFNRPESLHKSSAPFEVEAVVQTYSDFRRVSGSGGHEGRWHGSVNGYALLSGTLGVENKADQDGRIRRNDLRNGYLTSEIEFSSNTVRIRQDGRFADLFVAEWNGMISGEPEDADSTRYDVDVQAVDKVTLRMKGNKTGETVTVRFEDPNGQRRFSSDNPAHPTYSTADPEVKCPADTATGWYTRFLVENRKQPTVFKKGAFQGPKGFDFRENDRSPGFLP
jgi:hypothetical protein